MFDKGYAETLGNSNFLNLGNMVRDVGSCWQCQQTANMCRQHVPPTRTPPCKISPNLALADPHAVCPKHIRCARQTPVWAFLQCGFVQFSSTCGLLCSVSNGHTESPCVPPPARLMCYSERLLALPTLFSLGKTSKHLPKIQEVVCCDIYRSSPIALVRKAAFLGCVPVTTQGNQLWWSDSVCPYPPIVIQHVYASTDQRITVCHGLSTARIVL
jgi:hypothetical protein